jgi:hypothetical protein
MDNADEAVRFMERAVQIAPDSARAMSVMALQAFQGEAMVSAWWDSDGSDLGSDDFALAHNLKRYAEHVLDVRRFMSREELQPTAAEDLEGYWEQVSSEENAWQSRLMVRWLQSMVAAENDDAERAIALVQEALAIGEGRMSNVQRLVLSGLEREYEAQRR